MNNTDELQNKIDFLKEQNLDLSKAINKLKKENHERELRISYLENGLQEIRKFIENSDASKEIKESKIYKMTIKLSYPEGF